MSKKNIFNRLRLSRIPVLNKLPIFLAIPGIFICIISFISIFGKLHHDIDILSHFRIQYFYILLLLTFIFTLLRKETLVIVFLIFSVFNLSYLMPFYYSNRNTQSSYANADKIRVLMFNINYKNKKKDKITNYIKETNPDIILLNEVNIKMMKSFKKRLQHDYPQYQFAFRDKTNGILLMSKLNFKQSQEMRFDTFPTSIAATVEQKGTEFILVASHARNPKRMGGYIRQHTFLNNLTDFIKKQNKPLIVIGDLNDSTWSYKFREFLSETNLNDSRQGFGIQSSYNVGNPFLRIPIDHCLTTDQFQVIDRKTGPAMGSDHYPVIVDIAMPGKKGV